MRFASLASGSRGNALLVEHDATLVMVDCGVGVNNVEERLRCVDRHPRDIAALLLTHEHSDHVRGAAAFAKRHGVPVWTTAGTAAAASLTTLPRLRVLSSSRPLQIGALRIEPFTVPHDAREPCQFTFAAAGRRLGILSDIGHVTEHVRTRLTRCDAIALEFNHDLDALHDGSYPAVVKQRIASSLGHLNNAQAVDLLREIDNDDLQWVMALHISEANNSPGMVASALRSAIAEARSTALHRARQHETSDWLDIV